MGFWHAAVSAIVIALIFFAMQHFHFMANATRLARSVALAIIVFVVLIVFNAAAPGAAG